MTQDQDVGSRLKNRRKELGVTIRELARRSGLSASFISQLERGKTKVSLDSLRLIAEHLDVSIHYFFSEPRPVLSVRAGNIPCESDTATIEEYTPVVRAGCRPQLHFPNSGVNYELLMTDLTRQMEAIYGCLAPGTGNVARRLRKPTEEFIFVLSGALQVGLQENDYVLYPGDSIYFEGYDLTRLVCASEDENAIWVSIITPPAF